MKQSLSVIKDAEVDIKRTEEKKNEKSKEKKRQRCTRKRPVKHVYEDVCLQIET